MATALAKTGITPSTTDDIPQWKKDLIARLRNQNKKEERLWIDHHHSNQIGGVGMVHPHSKWNTMHATSPENGFDKDPDSPQSSDSEDLHYGPGIVNRLRNKYLSLALRESNARPTILRKATSLENLLDDEGEDQAKKEDRLYARRTAGNDGGNRYRSSYRRQEMKRARSVEVISRTNHEEELTMTSSVTAKINNRQSLHEDMLIHNVEEKTVLIENSKPYKKQISIQNGVDETDKYSKRINRPKRIPPLLNEREKPPVDVVKHAKMIFEKRPETRTKKPHQTGEVAAKVDSFNDIIVKTKVALKSAKPAIKNPKPVLNDKNKSNTHHVRPVAKPVILSEEIVKPTTLDLRSSRQEKKGFKSLPSPIPDVSRVDIKRQDGSDSRNHSPYSLCETPDIILTSSPKITSPTYRKRTTEIFINEERNRSFLGSAEHTDKKISPIHSPTKSSYKKLHSLNFNREELDLLGFKMISPISQNNITKSSTTSVFNFINSQIDQRHLPLASRTNFEQKSPVYEMPKTEMNGFTNGNKMKMTDFEVEKRSTDKDKKNAENGYTTGTIVSEKKVAEKTSEIIGKANDNVVMDKGSGDVDRSWQHLGNSVEKTSSIFEHMSKTAYRTKPISEPINSADKPGEIDKEKSIKCQKLPDKSAREKVDDKIDIEKTAEKNVLKSPSVSDKSSDEAVKIQLPKKPKQKRDESTIAVFNFTSRKEVPDYIVNDTSRAPSRPVIPKPDEPGIKLLPEALTANFKEIQEVWEEDELIRSLEARPPSPCDITFINDNVLIDGKSSLIQNSSKRIKLKISFVDDAKIFEYPSETSLLLEDSQLSMLGSPSSVGHSVPALSGSSSLASYTPKTTEDFQLGITKSFQEITPSSKSKNNEKYKETSETDVLLEEVDQPVLFSSGSTSDILF